MKSVAVFTTFYEATSGYSLIGVCETQLRFLLDHGYNPRVLVQNNFVTPPAPSVWNPETLDIRKVIPKMTLSEGLVEDFDARVELIYESLLKNLDGIDVCITHDIILQRFYKEHNVAMRRVAKDYPNILWLHWIHSCPTPSNGGKSYPEDCRYTTPPGYIIYPNETDLPMVQRTYKLYGQEWRSISNRASHAIDPLRVWNYDVMTRNIVRESDMLSGDIVAVYPVRLDRGKQPEKIIRLLAGVQSQGHDPRLIIADWQSAGVRFQSYIDQLLALATSLDLGGKVSFTSHILDECSQGVPRHVVSELMDLSNVYIHPSMVETYSLTVHEAMLRGCLCVLNGDFPVMRELWGKHAIYMDFGSDRESRTWDNEQKYWNDEALRLIIELMQNRALSAKTAAKRLWSPDTQWKEFAPLLYLTPVGV